MTPIKYLSLTKQNKELLKRIRETIDRISEENREFRQVKP